MRVLPPSRPVLSETPACAVIRWRCPPCSTRNSTEPGLLLRPRLRTAGSDPERQCRRQPQPDDQGQLLLVCQHDTVADLSRLCRLSQHHLAKLDTGHRIHREKQLGEVLNKLSTTPGADLPSSAPAFIGRPGQVRPSATSTRPRTCRPSKKDKEEGAAQ